MSPEQWLAAGSVFAAIVSGAFTAWASRRGSKRMAAIEKKKVEGAEFDRNKAITESIIANLRAEVDRLKQQVDELLVALDREKTENAGLRQLVRELTDTANQLRFQLTMLQRQLRPEGPRG